jgi:hypothetical protein
MTNAAISESPADSPAGLGVGQPVVRPRAGAWAKVEQWIFDHSELFLPVLRDLAPILVLRSKKIAIVSRYDDV